MLNKKKKMVMTVLDIIELLLLLIMLIIFTVIFRVVEEPIRFVFLFGDILIIHNFSKTLNNLENSINKNKVTNKKDEILTEVYL